MSEKLTDCLRSIALKGDVNIPVTEGDKASVS